MLKWMQRNILTTVVERACMACPAAKCRRECGVVTGGKRSGEGEGKLFLSSGCLLFGICFCVCLQRGRMGVLPSLAQMDAQCHSLLPSQRTGDLSLTIRVESPKMAERSSPLDRLRGRGVGALSRVRVPE